MWDKFLNWLGFHWVRNRDDKGRFIADDKKTKGKIMFLLDWIYDLVISVSLIISAASIVATLTPSKKDDEWLGKLYKLVDLVALNFKIKK